MTLLVQLSAFHRIVVICVIFPKVVVNGFACLNTRHSVDVYFSFRNMQITNIELATNIIFVHVSLLLEYLFGGFNGSLVYIF